MDEGLQLQVRRRFLPDGPDLLQAQLPGQDDPGGPDAVPGPGGLVIGNPGLGGDVAGRVGGVASRQLKGPQVRQDHRVHPGGLQTLQMGGEAVHFLIPGHGVDGAVDPDAMGVGEGHCLRQALGGEVPREGPHAEVRSRQIHRVRPVEHRHAQALQVPRRGQQLRPFTRHIRRC